LPLRGLHCKTMREDETTDALQLVTKISSLPSHIDCTSLNLLYFSL